MKRKQNILSTLWDGKWHGTPEMLKAAGHRFSEYVRQLRRKHIVIDTRKRPGGADYRLRTMRRMIDYDNGRLK